MTPALLNEVGRQFTHLVDAPVVVRRVDLAEVQLVVVRPGEAAQLAEDWMEEV